MDLAETDRLASCCLMMMTSRRRGERQRVYLPEISLVLVYVTYENTRGEIWEENTGGRRIWEEILGEGQIRELVG